jgi:hypothetical protein
VRALVTLGLKGEFHHRHPDDGWRGQFHAGSGLPAPLAGLSESQRQEVAQYRPLTGFVGREVVVRKPLSYGPARR